MGNSEANCGANTIQATVYSKSPEATATGISTNENSFVRAHNNDITATVINAELPNNLEAKGGVTNTGYSVLYSHSEPDALGSLGKTPQRPEL